MIASARAATSSIATDKQLRILAIGAHPDDCDLKCGGTTVRWVQAGIEVHFLSTTNGCTGHHIQAAGEVSRRRELEARAAARVAGAEYHCLGINCGDLTPSVELRRRLISFIREINPHLVLTHRPNDYHPDHRYTSIAVQDSLYLVTVPGQLPQSPHMRQSPIAMYFSDDFKRPYPFTPSVAVPLDEVMDRKIAMLDCHESQMYEWLPYNRGVEDEVPTNREDRPKWLAKWIGQDGAHEAERCREMLDAAHGVGKVQYAESFEECEYGRRLTPEMRAALFPFCK